MKITSQRKATLNDDKGKPFADNDERAIFFCRGVLETVKKLGWAPDLVHCHGWMTSLIPLFLKTSYKDEPLFNNAKVVYSLYNDKFQDNLNENFVKKVQMDGLTPEDTSLANEPSFDNLSKLAMNYSDGIIAGDEGINESLLQFASENDKAVLTYQNESEYVEAYNEFYDEVLAQEEVLAG